MNARASVMRLDVEDDRRGSARPRRSSRSGRRSPRRACCRSRRSTRSRSALVQRPVEHRGAERARLRDEGDVAGLRACRREAGVEVEARDDDAEAVRARGSASRRSAPAPRRIRCSSARPSVAGLPEAGRDDDHAADARLAARRAPAPAPASAGEQITARSGVRGSRADVGVALDAEHRLVARVDRVDHAAEARRRRGSRAPCRRRSWGSG